MISWILEQLEKQPGSLFYEKELLDKDATEFARLKKEKLITYVQPDEHNETYGLGQREPLTVVKIDGKFCGIDEQDPGKDPEPITLNDLAKYRFSLENFLGRVKAANNLSGTAQELDKRLYFIGKRTINDKRVTFLLGLFDSDKRASSLLTSYMVRLTDFDQVVAVTPSFTIGKEILSSEMKRLNIHIVPLAGSDLKLDVTTLLNQEPRSRLLTILTPEQERDYEMYGYKCRLPIHITGNVAGSGSNLVEVGNAEVEIGDVPFCLFLRLLLELYRNKAGAMSKSDLMIEGYLNADGEFQSIGRLRECFVRALGDLHPKKFIESYRPKTLRLSVHPDLVTWNQEKLLGHDDVRVCDLVGKLAAVGQLHIQ